MIPAPLDLPTIWRGCNWGPITFTWKDANGNPINLTSWTPRATSLNIDLNAVIVGNPANGVTQISLTVPQTANLKLGVEAWDWIFEDLLTTPVVRLPPFFSGQVPIKEPNTIT